MSEIEDLKQEIERVQAVKKVLKENIRSLMDDYTSAVEKRVENALNEFVAAQISIQPGVDPNDTAIRFTITLLAKAAYQSTRGEWGFVAELGLALGHIDPELANAIDSIRMARVNSGKYRADVKNWIDGDDIPSDDG